MLGKISVGLTAVGALGLGLIAAEPTALAATVRVTPGFAGTTASSMAGCPHIVWRLARTSNGQIHGVAYYSDLSGLSSVTGARGSNGNFQLTLTKTSVGDGPVGTVTGTAQSNGHIVAKLVGEGCANSDVNIVPVQDFNKWEMGTGGR